VAPLSQIVGVGHDWWEKVVVNMILMIHGKASRRVIQRPCVNVDSLSLYINVSSSHQM